MACWLCGGPLPNLSPERECAACQKKWGLPSGWGRTLPPDLTNMAYCWQCGRPTTVRTGLLPCGPCAEKGLAVMNTTDRLELLRFYRQLEAVPAAQLHDNPGTVEVVPLSPDKVVYNYVYTPLNEDTFIISNHILTETNSLVPFARVLVVQGKVLEVDLVDRNGHFPEQRTELIKQANLAAQTGAKNRPDPAGNG